MGEIIHQYVEQYLVAFPQSRSQVVHTGDGEYTIDGRDVKVGFCREGFLVVHDGPLRQPLTDYVEKKDSSAIYHQQGLRNSALGAQPKETRISFGDEGNRYSRLDAMKVAKEQAIFREKAAKCVREGGFVPADLREKYDKAIDIKLGQAASRQRQRTAAAAAAAPAAAPAAAAAPAWWPGTPTAGAAPTGSSGAPFPGRPLSHVPQPMMPAATSPDPNNLFGRVPDLMQLAAARGAPPRVGSAPKPPMLGSVATPMGLFAAAGAKAQPSASGLQQRTMIAGYCGA